MSKEDIVDMLNNIADGNFSSAEQGFNAAISDKVASALENIRVKVSSEMIQNEEVQLDEGVSPFKKGQVVKHTIGLGGEGTSKITLISDEITDEKGSKGHKFKCGNIKGFACTSSLKRTNRGR